MLGQDFFTQGFQIFDGSQYMHYIDVDSIQWQYEGGINNDYHPANDRDKIDSVLYAIHYQIALDIVEPSVKYYTIEKRRIWEGVNLDATAWHNDLKEGPNCFFLLYHSKMIDDGFVYFRNRREEWKILPEPGLLVAVNCLSDFEHKADVSSRQRVISSYYFNLSD